MKLGRYRVVLRPLMYFIVASSICGAVAVPAIRYYLPSKAAARPSYGYVNPTRWQVTGRNDVSAYATAFSNSNAPVLLNPKSTVFPRDMTPGIAIKIERTSGSADSVFLRNVLNLTEVQGTENLQLTFEGESLTAVHPILITIRDRSSLLWHDTLVLRGPWQTYRTTIPLTALRKATNNNLIVAFQIGSVTGEFSLRNIEMK